MKKILIFLCAILPSVVGAQTFETRYERSVHDLMQDVARRFGVRFKFDANVDTVGKQLPYADFRVVGNDTRQHLQVLRLELVETER